MLMLLQTFSETDFHSKMDLILINTLIANVMVTGMVMGMVMDADGEEEEHSNPSLGKASQLVRGKAKTTTLPSIGKEL